MADVGRKTPSNLYILRLTFLYFVAGMFIFMTAMILAIWIIPDLVQLQSLRNPEGWFLAHLFLLGWATMIAMGASLQITQVVMRASIYSRTLGYVQFVLYLLGFLGLIFGFITDHRFIVFGGGSIALGGLLYVFNLIMTFIVKKEWNLFVFGISLSLVALLMTIFLGLVMGIGFAYGFPSGFRGYEAVFGSHLWFGIAGWMSGLILIFSLKLLPMFYVSKKKNTRSTYWMIGIYHLGVWLHTWALWSDSQTLAVVATLSMAFALGWFTLHVNEVRKQSNGRQPIGVVKIAFILIPVHYFLFLLWSGLNVFGASSSAWNEAWIMTLILGWFSPTIWSYLSKILPFLWWARQFRTKEQKKAAVLLSEMLPERRMARELTGYLLSIAAILLGYMCQLPSVAFIGQLAAFCFTVVYLAELLRVFRY